MNTRVVVVSDGKRGHENQSRVLSRMLGDTEPLLMVLRDSARSGGFSELLLRLRLRFGGGRQALSRSRAARLVKTCLQPEDTQAFRDFAVGVREYPDNPVCIVSSGTPPATFNLVLTAMLGCRSIVNMSPSLLPHALFDVVVLPEHDLHGRPPADNELVSALALGYHEKAAAEYLASQIKRDNGLSDAEFWGVALGGPSKACRWEGDVILDELAQLRGLAKGEGVKLLVTTSRRTPDWCLAWLEKHYVGIPEVAWFLDASKDPLNPLPAFYEMCSRMFVSGDSFSMVSEAVHSGHCPVVMRVQPVLPQNKRGRALGYLADAGLALLPAGMEEDLPDRVARSSSELKACNLLYEELKSRLQAKIQPA